MHVLISSFKTQLPLWFYIMIKIIFQTEFWFKMSSTLEFKWKTKSPTAHFTNTHYTEKNTWQMNLMGSSAFITKFNFRSNSCNETAHTDLCMHTVYKETICGNSSIHIRTVLVINTLKLECKGNHICLFVNILWTKNCSSLLSPINLNEVKFALLPTLR